MALVKRGNVEYRVADHQVEEYLAKGYSLLDENGKVLRTKTPVNLEDFKVENVALKAQISKLEKENAELKAQLDEVKSNSKPEKPSEEKKA